MANSTYTLLDGKATSAQIKEEIATEVAAMVARGEQAPHLVAILVGHDGGSETYVASKIKTCQEVGFRSSLIRFEDDVTEETLLAEIKRLNEDPDVTGFIVQLLYQSTSMSRRSSRLSIPVRTSMASIQSMWGR